MQQEVGILPDGTVIQGRYVVEELLGKGGFGAVYRVRDQQAEGHLFALKEVIDPRKQVRERLLLEGDLLQRLHHLTLPCVYEVFDDELAARSYMLMEYIEGKNLEVLRRQRPGMCFSLEETLIILAPIFDAVAYLHRQSPPILHRDIKPANIIWTTTGEKTALVDFGISKEYDPNATTTAVRHCSRGYGAPEQYGVGTNTRTDIYGLGATLYTLLTGLVPVDAFTRITQLGNGEFDPLQPVNSLTPDVPIHIAKVIQRAMAIRSCDRFPTVGEFWQALHDAPTEEIPTSQAMSGCQPIVVSQKGESLQPAPISKRFDVSRFKRGGALLFLMFLISVGLGVSFFAYFVISPGASSAPQVSIPAHAAPAAFPTSRPTVESTVMPLTTPTHPTPTRVPTRPKPPHPKHPHHPHD